jgi:hypothetical protein
MHAQSPADFRGAFFIEEKNLLSMLEGKKGNAGICRRFPET